MPPQFDSLDRHGLRLLVNRTGAEMISLARATTDGNWVGFLFRDGETDAPAAGWSNHATVMGYFLHRLWKEHSVYRGVTIRGGNHGFLRHFAFDPPERTPESLTYRVSADRIPHGAYPLRVSLALTYRLSHEGVRIEFLFENHEETLDAHVSFGIHPGFSVGSPRTCRLDFPPGIYRRYFAPGNFLDGRTADISHPGGEPAFIDREALPDSYILGLEEVPRRDFVLEDDGRRVVLDFSEVPFLTVWSDMNPFLCIEPCWGLPDSNPPTAFEYKSGIQVVPPAGSLRRGFSIQPVITQ